MVVGIDCDCGSGAQRAHPTGGECGVCVSFQVNHNVDAKYHVVGVSIHKWIGCVCTRACVCVSVQVNTQQALKQSIRFGFCGFPCVLCVSVCVAADAKSCMLVIVVWWPSDLMTDDDANDDGNAWLPIAMASVAVELISMQTMFYYMGA